MTVLSVALAAVATLVAAAVAGRLRQLERERLLDLEVLDAELPELRAMAESARRASAARARTR